MMHPKYERGRMLDTAVGAAMHELDDPIDRIEIRGGKVHVWAGSRHVVLNYGYDNAYSDDGSVMPGSGRWWARLEGGDRDDTGRTQPTSLWRRLLGRQTSP